jgi:epoxyqueuosine reductase
MVDLWRRPDRELRSMVKGSAMTRAKIAGLRRNLAVAIGNSGEEAAIAALREHDADRPSIEDPMVQEHVEWALERAARRDEGPGSDGLPSNDSIL